MTPVQTAPHAIEALALELQEVEWLGRPPESTSPESASMLDLVLMAAGAIAGATLYLYGPF